MELGNRPQVEGKALFDSYTGNYEAVLNRALSPSGETYEYFARVRMLRVQEKLCGMGFAAARVLDYGCGIGGAVPFFQSILRPQRLLGVDLSPESIQRARQEHREERIEFAVCDGHQPHSEYDLGFCNGVLHHVRPDERFPVLGYIYEALRPGGLFALWENNPWNPGTRYIMKRCEFDRDAVLLSPPAARALLRRSGFQVVHTSSHFYFPHWLKWLRRLEPALSRLPLGGQYLILSRKPG